MYHTMLQATPVQLVFGCELILNNPFIEYLEYIRRLNQQLIDKNNQIKKNRKPHTYRVCEKVLLSEKKSNTYEDPYKVPYPITKL